MSDTAVLLFEDETILRLFPVARGAWPLVGEAAAIAITGNNAKRVLYGTINIRTGHRIVIRYSYMKQAGFHAFLHLLRRCYTGRQVWLVLDGAKSHTSFRSLSLADELNIELACLPKQCAELNGMDHFWRVVKGNISAN